MPRDPDEAEPEFYERTPIYGYPGDDPCEDCGAPAGLRCKVDCPTGLGEDHPFPPLYRDEAP